MHQRIARSNLRTFFGAGLGGALVGASTGMYAGSDGALAGSIIGFFVGMLAGMGIVSTKAWGDAKNRELDRHLVGVYEPKRPEESETDATRTSASTRD